MRDRESQSGREGEKKESKEGGGYIKVLRDCIHVQYYL